MPRCGRALLLAGVQRSMFDPRPINRTAAIRLVADVLEVVRSVASTPERAAYEAVYGTSSSWLMGSRVTPVLSGTPASPIQSSHGLAAKILNRAAQALGPGQTLDWQGELLLDPRSWWQSPHLRYERDSLTMGPGPGTDLIVMVPALRLACTAIGVQTQVADPSGTFMAGRDRVTEGLAQRARRFHRGEDLPERLEQERVSVRAFVGTAPPDERLAWRAGNLLLRLGRPWEAEESFQRCVRHRLCSGWIQASALYDLACVAARTERPDRCRELLQQSLRLRPLHQNRQEVAQGPDFASVSNTDWFRALLSQ